MLWPIRQGRMGTVGSGGGPACEPGRLMVFARLPCATTSALSRRPVPASRTTPRRTSGPSRPSWSSKSTTRSSVSTSSSKKRRCRLTASEVSCDGARRVRRCATLGRSPASWAGGGWSAAEVAAGGVWNSASWAGGKWGEHRAELQALSELGAARRWDGAPPAGLAGNGRRCRRSVRGALRDVGTEPRQLGWRGVSHHPCSTS